jgi:hypothetical protein
MKEPNYFFVTSYGRTATMWLTHALDLHPDIVCTHGPSLHHSEGSEDFVQIQKTASLFYAIGLKKILASIGAGSNKKCIGNIHAYTALNLSIKQNAERDAPRIRSVNLLRHPITRINSFWGRFRYERTLNSPMAQWINEESLKQPRYQQVLQELQSHHDVTIESFDERAFFHAVMQMSTDSGDLPIHVPHIVSERLVADIDYFCYVLELLIGDDIPISTDYLSSVTKLGKLNAAKDGGRSAIQVFEEWQPWQRTLFLLFLRDHPSLQEAYTSFGYSLLRGGFKADLQMPPIAQSKVRS